MITAVDTNILIDFLEPDPVYGTASLAALKRCLLEGSVVACEVVWAEVAVAYGHAVKKVVEALHDIGIEYSGMGLESALEASKCWYDYLKKGKGAGRDRIAADFLIGGHALKQCERLLTRDRGFYRTCFKNLRIESP